ncbi:phosphate ABC transporter substrate-binding protein PstS [Arthrobacter sp. B6]|uniref:phosphate ABC transporter substrate-binding protein PstS n=1 Tax=Arthrobacter sp. B6 TaxID=1570137 RepID=UPI00082BF123|nr:phosphate ABC transporter substrate-binding protein PstS [Arthrobacter sp. B6]
MKPNRSTVAAAFLAAAGLMVSGCGSDDNSDSLPSRPGLDAESAQVDCGGKRALKSSGSTAQANAMTRFVAVYEVICDGKTLDYTSNGSGAGVSEFTGGQTDIGGSDSPLNEAKSEYEAAKARCGSDAWNLPVVFGPLAVTYNVPGVDELALDGPTLAKIFNGTVSSWDDPAIAALNPGLSLPAEKINVVYRSDESGTTDNFQQYLDAASDGAWGKGAGKSFAGSVGEGAKGNEGTSAAIKGTEGSITYNEWSFATAQKLKIASIVTSSGPEPVKISNETVAKTIAGATIKGAGNDLVLDTSSFYRPTQAGAYPIVLATYHLVCSKYPDPDTATAVKAFMQSTIGVGQTGLSGHGYIPLPEEFKIKLAEAIASIS